MAQTAKKITDELRGKEGLKVVVFKNGDSNNTFETLALENTETVDNERPYYSFAEAHISVNDIIFLQQDNCYLEILEVEKQEINSTFIQLKVFYKLSKFTPDTHESFIDPIQSLATECDGNFKYTMYKACQRLKELMKSTNSLEEKMLMHYEKQKVQGILNLSQSLIATFDDPNTPPIIEIQNIKHRDHWLAVFANVIEKLQYYENTN